MNSGMLGECGCKHMPSFALQTYTVTAVAVHLPSSSAPAVPGMVDSRAWELFERVMENKQV